MTPEEVYLFDIDLELKAIYMYIDRGKWAKNHNTSEGDSKRDELIREQL